jgi:hypothetical protein
MCRSTSRSDPPRDQMPRLRARAGNSDMLERNFGGSVRVRLCHPYSITTKEAAAMPTPATVMVLASRK